MNIRFDMMDDTLPPEKIAEMQKQMTDLTTQFNAEAETMLGKDNYNVLKTYEETQPERTTVDVFNKSLSADTQLNETQMNDLIFDIEGI